jgi:hypothetical protein
VSLSGWNPALGIEDKYSFIGLSTVTIQYSYMANVGHISTGAITVLYVINFNFKTAIPVWAIYCTQPYNLQVKMAIQSHD